MVYTRDGSDKRTKTILTPDADAAKRCFSDEDACKIADWCVKIEDHYSKHHGHTTPMDIEWAKDGITGDLFIVQARPETGKSTHKTQLLSDFMQLFWHVSSCASYVYTVRSAQKANLLKQTQVTEHNPPVIEGSAIGSDAASGRVRVIRDVSEVSTIKPGEILVADMTVSDE